MDTGGMNMQNLDSLRIFKPMQGKVVLAATPIGNTSDASARLAALMEHATIVAAEDTRRLYDLANRMGIRVEGRVIAYHDHNERQKADSLLDQVEAGATVLVVSDAGMPTINDPGLAIVRRAIERGLPVTCAPGPSAVLDALALSGLPTDRFCYEGFLPRKHSERLRALRLIRSEARTIVYYETPHRISDSMDDLLEILGPNRPMALARELTKDYEEVRRGSVSQIRSGVIADPPRGEIVLVIAGSGYQPKDKSLLSNPALSASSASSASSTDALSAESMNSLDFLARLSLDYSRKNQEKIKQAISRIIPDHPLADGSVAKSKDVYAAVLRLKD